MTRQGDAEGMPGGNPTVAHVLVVEDEPSIAEAVRFLLTRAGHQVTVLGDGTSVEAALARQPADLLVLDLMLPGLSGLEILRALRARPETAAMPVMMLTARGQDRDRTAAERAGVDLFMAKPFSNAELLQAAQTLLARGPAADRGAVGA